MRLHLWLWEKGCWFAAVTLFGGLDYWIELITELMKSATKGIMNWSVEVKHYNLAFCTIHARQAQVRPTDVNKHNRVIVST